MDVLVVLTEAKVIHVVGCRVAYDVCKSSARMENTFREERSICLLVFVPPLEVSKIEETAILPVPTGPSLPFRSYQLT